MASFTDLLQSRDHRGSVLLLQSGLGAIIFNADIGSGGEAPCSWLEEFLTTNVVA